MGSEANTTNCGSATSIQSQPWLDLVVRSRVSTQPHFSATGPVSRRAATPPRHRADEPPSPQAPEKNELASSTPTPRTVPGAPRECRAPTPPRSAFRLLSTPAHSRAWPFAVARATRVYRRKSNQLGSDTRATALARCDHPTAMGEVASSVTLPPNSSRANAWSQEAPILQSPGDRRERRKREARPRSTSASQPQRSHSKRATRSAPGPKSA